jgi:hypothetical protein
VFKYSEFEQRISNCDLPPDDKAVILLAVAVCWNGMLMTRATSYEERKNASDTRDKSAKALAAILILGDGGKPA